MLAQTPQRISTKFYLKKKTKKHFAGGEDGIFKVGLILFLPI